MTTILVGGRLIRDAVCPVVVTPRGTDRALAGLFVSAGATELAT